MEQNQPFFLDRKLGQFYPSVWVMRLKFNSIFFGDLHFLICYKAHIVSISYLWITCKFFAGKFFVEIFFEKSFLYRVRIPPPRCQRPIPDSDSHPDLVFCFRLLEPCISFMWSSYSRSDKLTFHIGL